jgi:hypothetical protein
MTMILILNAVSSLLAAVGTGGLVAYRRRRARRTVVQPLYLNSR